MKLKYYGLSLLTTFAIGVFAALFLLPTPQHQIDMVEINDVTMRLASDFNTLRDDNAPLPKSKYDYSVIDAEGKLLKATRQGLSESVDAALRQGDIILDITKDGRILGKVIIHNDTDLQLKTYRSSLQLLVIVMLAVMAMLGMAFLIVVHRQVLHPFQKMKGFAQRVAAGELDAPLQMDKRNAFGAFTESFDLMREELRRARENEQAAERSKRELIASLSHDIQTPVSSIKAVAEVMEVTADESQAQKLKTIQDKATQIQTLVTDLFHTTLEELDSLNVQVLSVSSIQIAEMIKTADYKNQILMEDVPGCLVKADPARLAQVMDNLIANSYKYAGTSIHLYAKIDEDHLVVTLRDHGPGVAEEEISRLCIKYFRGKSAEGKNGYGLGLFIARHLIERMGGELECMNAQPGFAVNIRLKLDA